MTQDQTFPIDWNEWRKEWAAWLEQHSSQLHLTRDRFPGKNFLADEKLGTWNVNGRTVELSEVTFPNLEERDPETGRLLHYTVRGVGITFGIGADASGTVVHNFAELEDALGISTVVEP